MSQMTIDGRTVELRPAGWEEVIDLRHVVLRDGLPRSEAIFPGDDLPTSRHYGAFHDRRTVCCVTLHASQWEGEPAWQLRGMATAAEFQGRGIGTAVMQMLETDVTSDSPVRLLWCNARVPAARFYQEQGWTIRSDVFDIPTAGPHYRMTKRLG